MIFSIRNLGFELGSLLLEGWAAFAARVVCAALLLVLGWLARQLLSRKVCPALLRRNWRLTGTPILLRSFACGDLFLMILLLAGIFVASFLNEAVCLTLIITLMAAGCCKLPFKWYFSHRM